jgi:hypothetical protein
MGEPTHRRLTGSAAQVASPASRRGFPAGLQWYLGSWLLSVQPRARRGTELRSVATSLLVDSSGSGVVFAKILSVYIPFVGGMNGSRQQGAFDLPTVGKVIVETPSEVLVPPVSGLSCGASSRLGGGGTS